MKSTLKLGGLLMITVSAVCILMIISIPISLPMMRQDYVTVAPAQADANTLYLEVSLSKSNIVLSDIPDAHEKVHQWLISDPQYYTMAQSILTALAGNRVKDSIPLDVIISKYRVRLGGTEGTNFPADQYKDIEQTKAAIFDTWKERHPDLPQQSFDEIIESIK